MTARAETIERPVQMEAAPVTPHRRDRTRLAPAAGWPGVNGRELWMARDLVLFLAWRDVKVRYAQTVLGAAWAILQPVTAMAVFTVIFGRFARIPSDGVPYAAFSLAALVPWTYFAAALSGASNSLVMSSNLLTKVYFPRLAIPIAPLLAGLVDFVIAFAVLLLVLAGVGLTPSPWAVLVIPWCLLTAMLTAAGVGSALAALNVQYRDVKQITPFLLQVWMYTSPIVYPLSMVPPEYRALYSLNPMVGVVAGFRAALLRHEPLPWTTMALSFVTSLLLLVAGTIYFRHTERVFADVA